MGVGEADGTDGARSFARGADADASGPDATDTAPPNSAGADTARAGAYGAMPEVALADADRPDAAASDAAVPDVAGPNAAVPSAAGPHAAFPEGGRDADRPDARGRDLAPDAEPVPDHIVLGAAKALLAASWMGAAMMVYSIVHLYAFGLRPGASVPAAVATSIGFLAIGGAVWWGGRGAYRRLDVHWGQRAEWGAFLFAATAIVFWILFVMALWLVSRGVAVY